MVKTMKFIKSRTRTNNEWIEYIVGIIDTSKTYVLWAKDATAMLLGGQKMQPSKPSRREARFWRKVAFRLDDFGGAW